MLNARTGFVGDFHFSIRMAVGVDDDSAKLHAWAQLTFEGRKQLAPDQIPDGLARLVFKQSGVEIAINTQSLDSEWLQATNYSGRFDIAVRQESDWKKLQKIPADKKLLHITEVTGMGAVLGLASGKGKLHIASAMGPYVLQLVEMPGRSPEGPISRLLSKHGITLFGFKREEKGYRCTISLGFSSDPQRTSASILLSRRRHPGINRGHPIQVSYVWDKPVSACATCYHPDNQQGYSLHPKEPGSKAPVCPNKNDVCSLCHRNSHQISGCGLEFKHQRVAPQAHFVVEQSSSLSEGALSALGGAGSRTGAASVASSSLSTSQVRKFLPSSDEGMHSNLKIPSITTHQMKSNDTDDMNRVHRGLTSICLLSSTLTFLVLVPTVVFYALLHSVALLVWCSRQTIKNKYRSSIVLVVILIILASCSNPPSTKHPPAAPPGSSPSQLFTLHSPTQ